MLGAMQEWDLVMSHAIDHAAREHGDREIVTLWSDRSETRTDWRGIHHDAKRLAEALRAMGIQKGERVATLAMNHAHHLSSFYGITGMGGVVHTLNPRLFADQLAYIVNHAESRVLFYDVAFKPLVDAMKEHWKTVDHYVCFDNGEYTDLLDQHDGTSEWTKLDERDPLLLCYTSGTTGDPKGVLYNHRGNMLHSMASLQTSSFGFEPRSVMLPVVPMFHANGWGIPWAAPMGGAKLAFSTIYEPDVLLDFMHREKVTQSAGVPTVWLGLFQYMEATGKSLPDTLDMAVIGGAAAPRAMVEKLMEMGCEVGHAWGMTETSPIGTVGMVPAEWEDMSFDERAARKTMQGKPLFGTEIRLVDLDDHSTELPRDGETSGALQIRGAWVVKRYFKQDEDCVNEDNWFDTGDVGVIHPHGTLELTDRTKDLIKSGGEWISSVELENAAVGHPAVAEAAAFAIPDLKWDERPMLALVLKDGKSCDQAEMQEFLKDKVAKWWIPERIVVLDEIPHTATGKISKKDLRATYSD
ncbi:long-chain fatty acid--CoA ligase [Paraurantiacibacter namhicola]|uniref:3-methylmercaptopropionyl-CoA ligase n=1 Tax=Paraurantiacibacter namhicola TaxID=645517 RepID=A0A1C7D9N4_9SPHN|nr:long-chain fatty acid--CoA ligase [Paraurantiacibacter namhicola]ANU08158.1 Long-chain-fatty-acid--CoA ligase [Paraurantiacibacter namhicola]